MPGCFAQVSRVSAKSCDCNRVPSVDIASVKNFGKLLKILLCSGSMAHFTGRFYPWILTLSLTPYLSPARAITTAWKPWQTPMIGQVEPSTSFW